MLNHRSKAILKREIRQQIFSKKFVIMTVSMPLIMILMIGMQIFISNFDREEHTTLRIVNESAGFQALLQQQFAGSDFADNGLYQLDYHLLQNEDITAVVDRERAALLRGQLTGIVYIPDRARDNKQIHYYSSNPANQNLLARLRDQVNRAVVGDYFEQQGMDSQAIQFARTNVSIEGIRISRDGNTTLNAGNLVIAFLFTFLIYISLLSMGPAVMAAVNEEKTSRIVEVLLSAVTPNELMYGKILGTAITGLLQMAIWISPLIILSLVSLPALVMMDSLDLQLGAVQTIYFLLNYLMGLLVFLGIFAAFGAMFDTPQDAQGSMMPVMMLVIIPFFLAFSLARNPANVLAEVSSMLPFATIMVMPARMTLIDVPLWQLGLAMLVNLATIWLCIRGSAKIYRTTILMTGKRPAWSEIWKWLRHD
jgi:ABC-2 type transport system permease protein